MPKAAVTRLRPLVFLRDEDAGVFSLEPASHAPFARQNLRNTSGAIPPLAGSSASISFFDPLTQSACKPVSNENTVILERKIS